MQFCNVSHVFHLREPVHGNCHGKLFYLTRPHRPYAISFCRQWKSPDSIEQTPADKQLKAVSNIRQQEASSHMEQILGSVSFQIPHSSEVEAQFLEGELLGELGLKESRAFRREIEKISREVFGV